MPVSSPIAETSSTSVKRERGGRRSIAGHLRGHECAVQRFAASVAFAVALTVVCQVSRVACWVRLTSSENCATACLLLFTLRSKSPRPASIAAFCASKAVLRTASLCVGPGAEEVPAEDARLVEVGARSLDRGLGGLGVGAGRLCGDAGGFGDGCGSPTRACHSWWWTSSVSFAYYPVGATCDVDSRCILHLVRPDVSSRHDRKSRMSTNDA